MIAKILAVGTVGLLGVALAAAMPPGPPYGPDPQGKAKKKEGPGPGPGGDLKKTYDMLRRLKSDGRGAGRPEERLKDWTERATKLYRDAVKASERGDERRAREFGTAAHDLARAIDHVRNTATSDFDDLPPPPGAGGPQSEDERTRRDLARAHGRIVDLREADRAGAKFYLDASRDLYNAARRDALSGRLDRAGELARAAEALTHVPEHIARASGEGPEPKEKRDRPEPKAKRDRPEPPPKEERDRPGPDDAIPPPID